MLDHTDQGSGVIPLHQGELFYSQSGQGSLSLLWMHGLPLNSDAWAPQLQHFDPLVRSAVFDLRGYGRSSKLPPAVDSITDLYVDDILRVMAHCRLDKPVLIGFASAGHQALRFAALYPEKISHLIVINGSPCFMSRPDWQGGFDQVAIDDMLDRMANASSDDMVYRYLLDVAMSEQHCSEMAALKDWYVRLAEQAGLDTIKGFFTNISKDDDRALMRQIIAPTLIISSRLGKGAPSATALFLRQQIPNAQLFEVNDIDHFAYAMKSNLINRMIEQFLLPRCDVILPRKTS
jgi:pimeloyl-ACP methyl ester carboxylesterase